MKKAYEKPTAVDIEYGFDEPIMNDILIPSWEIGEDDDLEST